MSRFFASIGVLATKVESWWALGLLLMSAGGFTWLAQQWIFLASQGWAAVILVAVFFAALVICALSLSYFAISKFRSQTSELPPEAALIREKRMLIKAESNKAALTARPEEDQAVTLRAGPEVGFDCSKGNRFYLELSSNAILLAPEKPKEGTYDLIVLQGEHPKTFAYASAYEIDLDNFPEIDFTPNSLTVIRIDILKFGSKFRYFPTRIGGQPMNASDKAAISIAKHQNFR